MSLHQLSIKCALALLYISIMHFIAKLHVEVGSDLVLKVAWVLRAAHGRSGTQAGLGLRPSLW